MRLLTIVLLIAFIPSAGYADTTRLQPQVKQQVVYTSSRASAMYLLWTMNNWNIPAKNFLPAGTIIKDGMAWTKMSKRNDSFFAELQLLSNIYIDFMFRAERDSAGITMEGWDDHWGENYNLLVKGDPPAIYDDSHLAFVEPQQKIKEFHLLKEGTRIFCISLFIMLSAWGLFVIKRWPVKFNMNNFLSGMAISAFMIMMLARMDMNGIFFQQQYLVPGCSFYDLVFLSSLSLVFMFFINVFSRRPLLKNIFATLAIILIAASTIFSILNIEIVKQLGRPLTYSWLYYSDFLRAADAKNALKANLSEDVIINILLITVSLPLLACALNLVLNNIKQKHIIIPALTVLFAITGWIQLQQHNFNKAKTQNPVFALATSWFFSDKNPALFSMKVSQKYVDLIQKQHRHAVKERIPLAEKINHVVFFIMESTPASLLQVYDSTFRVTPHLNEWKKYSLIYNNMYAHLPNTVNSVFSLTCSMYPLINYKAVVTEYPGIRIPALPQLLKDRGWNTSFFFSSDLSYGNIGKFLKLHGTENAEDLTTIPCNSKKFQSNYAQLEGLDDCCIVSRYFSWREKLAGKSFSMLWTNQTHYPYFSNDNIKYSDNAALNPYLNALKNDDEAFHQLMTGLEERGQLENTLVVVVGDHGEAFGTHAQFSHASNIYEENLHVPCLLIYPVLFNGARDNRAGGLIDIPPTIMHLLNMPTPAQWQGTSLLGPEIKDHTFFLVPFSDFLFGSRTANWKFIYNATTETYELYDLSKDPGELKNVANDHLEIVKQEYEILAAWVQYHNLTMKGVIAK